MIEISSRAWHLRLVRMFNEGYEPTSLCSYFWAVVFAMAGLPFFAAFIVLTFPTWGLACALTWLWQKRPRSQPPVHTEPNLLVEWVKAKKRRVCPLIVVKENDDATLPIP